MDLRCKNKDVILITTHVINPRVVNLYYKIRNALGYEIDVYLLVQQCVEDVDIYIPCWINYEFFTKKDIFSLGLAPLKDSITPGSNHFILIWFYLNHIKYHRYWVIEYDVDFSGDWRIFFDAVKVCDADFLATHIKHYEEDPFWYWWGSMVGEISKIPLECRLRSFNPVMRISDDALRYIVRILTVKGNAGHHEEVIPTLLFQKGYSIVDLGGVGDFAFRGESIISFCSYNNPLPFGTMRHKPTFSQSELIAYPNKLFHPIKSDCPLID